MEPLKPHTTNQFQLTNKKTAAAIRTLMRDGIGDQRLCVEGVSVPGSYNPQKEGPQFAVKGETYLKSMYRDVMLEYSMETIKLPDSSDGDGSTTATSPTFLPCNGKTIASVPAAFAADSDDIIPGKMLPISGLDIYATVFNLTEDMDCYFRHGISKQTADDIVKRQKNRGISRMHFYEHSQTKTGKTGFRLALEAFRKEGAIWAEAAGTAKARTITNNNCLVYAPTNCNLTFSVSQKHDATISFFLSCEYVSPVATKWAEDSKAKVVEPSWIARVVVPTNADGKLYYFDPILSETGEKRARFLEELLRMIHYEYALYLHGDTHVCPKCGYLLKMNAIPDCVPTAPKFAGPLFIRDRFCPRCNTTPAETDLLIHIYRTDFQDCFAGLVTKIAELK